MRCKFCGGKNVIKKGKRINPKSIVQKYNCKDCKKYFSKLIQIRKIEGKEKKKRKRRATEHYKEMMLTYSPFEAFQKEKENYIIIKSISGKKIEEVPKTSFYTTIKLLMEEGIIILHSKLKRGNLYIVSPIYPRKNIKKPLLQLAIKWSKEYIIKRIREYVKDEKLKKEIYLKLKMEISIEELKEFLQEKLKKFKPLKYSQNDEKVIKLIHLVEKIKMEEFLKDIVNEAISKIGTITREIKKAVLTVEDVGILNIKKSGDKIVVQFIRVLG